MEVNVRVRVVFVPVVVRMNPSRGCPAKSPNAQPNEYDSYQALTPPGETLQIQQMLKSEEQAAHGSDTQRVAKAPA